MFDELVSDFDVVKQSLRQFDRLLLAFIYQVREILCSMDFSNNEQNIYQQVEVVDEPSEIRTLRSHVIDDRQVGKQHGKFLLRKFLKLRVGVLHCCHLFTVRVFFHRRFLSDVVYGALYYLVCVVALHVQVFEASDLLD